MNGFAGGAKNYKRRPHFAAQLVALEQEYARSPALLKMLGRGVRIRSRRKAGAGAVQGQLQAAAVSRIRVPTSRRAER